MNKIKKFNVVIYLTIILISINLKAYKNIEFEESLNDYYNITKTTINYNDNFHLKMEGKWDIDVDLQKLMFNMSSINGIISNSEQDVYKSKLILFLSDEEDITNGNSKINGYEICHVDLGKIKRNTFIKNIKIKNKITKFPPKGKYNIYILIIGQDKNMQTNIKTIFNTKTYLNI